MDVSELILDGLLENLASRVGAKVESVVSPQTFMSCEYGDVSALCMGRATDDDIQLEDRVWRIL